MTGSGKSEFIITYILSMCINYSPLDVNFILIDYKGGGLAGAFENKKAGLVLPHLVGTITNLDKAELDRTLVSISSEIKHRQIVFNDARDKLGESTIDIYKYQKFYKEGYLDIPVPHLFIICDEFAELKDQQPEFIENLISVARIGRSLGIHLILATQKPSGVVNDQIWSNSKFRVCLKVQDESDSREMLKRPEAADIVETGRYYLQVGNNEYFALGQSAYSGAKYFPAEKIMKQVDKSLNFINNYGYFIKSVQAASNVLTQSKGDQLTSILESIIEVSNLSSKKAERLWLENIPENIYTDDLINKYQVSFNQNDCFAIIGEYDAPEIQTQGLLTYNLINDGNTIIMGTDGKEREEVLNTIIYSTTKNYSPNDIVYYIIDYGSEELYQFSHFPHVGGYVSQSDKDKYNNLIKLLKKEISNRKKLFSNYGGSYNSYIKETGKKLPIFTVIINNYDSFFDNNQNSYDIYGVVFILSCNASNSVHSRLSLNFDNIYALKLKDSSEYVTAFGVKTNKLPREYFGRGLVNNNGVHEFQTSKVNKPGESLNSVISSYINKYSDINVKHIPELPSVVSLDIIGTNFKGLNQTPIGILKNNLDLYNYDFTYNNGTIISSNKIVNTEKFVKSLLFEFIKTNNLNTIIIDAINSLNLNKELFKNYYNSNYNEVIDEINNYIKRNDFQNNQVVIFVYGLTNLIDNLNNNILFDELLSNVRLNKNVNIVAVDSMAKLKNISFESWYTKTFSVNDGIWIGRGVADQSIFRISNINKEMYEIINNNMGYVIDENSADLIKMINFISSEGDEDE